MPDPKTGHDCFLYYNTGNHNTPTWVLIDDVGDVSKSQEYALREFKSRASRWVANLPTTESASLEVLLKHDINATVFDALEGFYTNRTVTEYFVADGLSNTNGTKGFRFGGIISSWPEDQNLEDDVEHSITIVPGYFSEANARIEPDIHEV